MTSMYRSTSWMYLVLQNNDYDIHINTVHLKRVKANSVCHCVILIRFWKKCTDGSLRIKQVKAKHSHDTCCNRKEQPYTTTEQDNSGVGKTEKRKSIHQTVHVCK